MHAFKLGIILALIRMLEAKSAINSLIPDEEDGTEIWQRTFQAGWFPVSLKLNKTSLTDLSTAETMLESLESNKSTNATQGISDVLFRFLKPILNSIEIEFFPEEIAESGNRTSRNIKLNFSDIVSEQSERKFQYNSHPMTLAFSELFRGVASFISTLTMGITNMITDNKPYKRSSYSTRDLKGKRKKRLEMLKKSFHHLYGNASPLQKRFFYNENHFRSNVNPKELSVNSIDLIPKAEHLEIPNELNSQHYPGMPVQPLDNVGDGYYEIALTDNTQQHAEPAESEFIIPLRLNIIPERNNHSSSIRNRRKDFKISISVAKDNSEHPPAAQQVTQPSTPSSNPIYYDPNSNRNAEFSTRMDTYKELDLENKTLHLVLVIR